MLQLCFWFGLSYSLFASAGTIGAILINSSLNANPSNTLDTVREAPVCVNNTRHPMWGLDLDEFDFTACSHAVELLRPNIASFLYHSYNFYSRKVYPSGIGPTLSGAWPLAQGTATAGCVLVIRMTRDFADDSLPTTDGRFAPTRRAQDIQQSSWLFLFRIIESLLSGCVQRKGLPGWSMESKNIVVALWPRFSDIDKAYGLRVISPEPDMNTSWLLLNP